MKDRPTRLGVSLTSRYLVALGLIAFLTTLSAGGLQIVVGEQDSMAKIIELSSRQAMHTQRILYYATLATSETDHRRARMAQRGLKAAIRLMDREHAMLTHGFEGMEAPAQRSAALREIHFERQPSLDTMVHDYLSHARVLVAADAGDLANLKDDIDYIRNYGASILPHSLNGAVRAYRDLAHSQIRRVEWLEIVTWSASLLVLVLIGRFIFRPMVQRIERETASLQAAIGERQRATEVAMAASRTKSEFLANMSHELRTPLNAIIGFSEIIRDERIGAVGNDKYRDYANDILASGKHLLDLINDILNLSKIEAGTDELNEEEIEVPPLLESVAVLVGNRANRDDVRMIFEVPDSLPRLRVDPRKLKQILVNLLDNGIKFTPAAGQVTLRARCGAKGGYEFQVVDTGIGIADEDIPKALSKFGQVESTLNRNYEGTGLGLPLAKSLAEQHGGSLELQSCPGDGTTVIVRFPAERTLPAYAPMPETAPIERLAS